MTHFNSRDNSDLIALRDQQTGLILAAGFVAKPEPRYRMPRPFTSRIWETMAAVLAATGQYRILCKLEPRRLHQQDDRSPTKLGIMLDLETTGLDPRNDEIIEFAMAPFVFTPDGLITGIHPAFSRLREPASPLPEKISALTGIDDADDKRWGRHAVSKRSSEIRAFVRSEWAE